jgi:hypothetical protein
MSVLSIINGYGVTQLSGTVIRSVTGSNEARLAIATTSADTSNIIGLRITNVAIGDVGPLAPFEPGMKIRMETEPSLYLPVYLSGTNPGVGAQVAGDVEVLLGVCYAKENVGGVWFATCTPVALPIVPAGGQWTTVYDVDYSALPDQSLMTLGTYTIDGKDGYRTQNNSYAAEFAVQNGYGLYIRQNFYTGDFDSGPQFYNPLTNFFPDVEKNGWSSLRVWFLVSTKTEWNENFAGHYVGVERISYGNPPAVAETFRAGALSQYENGIKLGALTYVLGGTLSQNISIKPTVWPFAMCYMVELDKFGLDAAVRTLPVADMAWPSAAALYPGQGGRIITVGGGRLDRLAIFANVRTVGSTNERADCLIRRMKIEYK